MTSRDNVTKSIERAFMGLPPVRKRSLSTISSDEVLQAYLELGGKTWSDLLKDKSQFYPQQIVFLEGPDIVSVLAAVLLLSLEGNDLALSAALTILSPNGSLLFGDHLSKDQVSSIVDFISVLTVDEVLCRNSDIFDTYMMWIGILRVK